MERRPLSLIYCRYCDTHLHTSKFQASGLKRKPPRCAHCQEVYMQTWYTKHPRYSQNYNEVYWEANKEKLSESNKAYYKANKEHLLSKSSTWHKENPTTTSAQRGYTLAWENRFPERHMWSRVRKAAAIRGIEFTISESDIVIPTHCPLLGIPLTIARGRKGGKDNSPSLDRIYNNHGYIPGNVMVISWRANLIKSVGTADELITIGTRLKAMQIRRPLLALPE